MEVNSHNNPKLEAIMHIHYTLCKVNSCDVKINGSMFKNGLHPFQIDYK